MADTDEDKRLRDALDKGIVITPDELTPDEEEDLIPIWSDELPPGDESTAAANQIAELKTKREAETRPPKGQS